MLFEKLSKADFRDLLSIVAERALRNEICFVSSDRVGSSAPSVRTVTRCLITVSRAKALEDTENRLRRFYGLTGQVALDSYEDELKQRRKLRRAKKWERKMKALKRKEANEKLYEAFKSTFAEGTCFRIQRYGGKDQWNFDARVRLDSYVEYQHRYCPIALLSSFKHETRALRTGSDVLPFKSPEWLLPSFSPSTIWMTTHHENICFSSFRVPVQHLLDLRNSRFVAVLSLDACIRRFKLSDKNVVRLIMQFFCSREWII